MPQGKDATCVPQAVAREARGKEFQLHRVPQPINGIEQLKKMIDTHILVLKPLDPLMLEALTYKDQDGQEKVSSAFTTFCASCVRWDSEC